MADSEASFALIVSLPACGKDNSHRQGLMNLTSVLLPKRRELIAFDYRGDCLCVHVCVYVCTRVCHIEACVLSCKTEVGV